MTPDDDYIIRTLRVAAGQEVPGYTWGAATTIALEELMGRGLVRRIIRDDAIIYEATEEGVQYLKDYQSHHRG